MHEEPASLRLDKWLVVARFAKTRAAAVRLIASGHVRIAGKPVKAPDRRLHPGDILTLALPHLTTVVEVVAIALKRGPADQARTLYRALPPALSHSATGSAQEP